MTITLAAVYAPIGFVSGLTGALFREFAFTLAGAVIVSGVIALTLSPMMCSKLLRSAQLASGRFVRFLDRTFERPQARAISAASPARSTIGPSPLLVVARRHRRDGAHVHDRAEGAGARGGPGHPLQPRQDAARRQPRLSRAGHRRTSTRCSRPCPRRSTCSPSTAWAATCTRRSPASCSSRGRSATARRQQILQEPAAEGGGHRRRPGAVAFGAALAAGLDRRPAGAVRHHHDGRLRAARAGARPRCSRRRRRAASSSSPTPT